MRYEVAVNVEMIVIVEAGDGDTIEAREIAGRKVHQLLKMGTDIEDITIVHTEVND